MVVENFFRNDVSDVTKSREHLNSHNVSQDEDRNKQNVSELLMNLYAFKEKVQNFDPKIHSCEDIATYVHELPLPNKPVLMKMIEELDNLQEQGMLQNIQYSFETIKTQLIVSCEQKIQDIGGNNILSFNQSTNMRAEFSTREYDTPSTKKESFLSKIFSTNVAYAADLLEKPKDKVYNMNDFSKLDFPTIQLRIQKKGLSHAVPITPEDIAQGKSKWENEFKKIEDCLNVKPNVKGFSISNNLDIYDKVILTKFFEMVKDEKYQNVDPKELDDYKTTFIRLFNTTVIREKFANDCAGHFYDMSWCGERANRKETKENSVGSAEESIKEIVGGSSLENKMDSFYAKDKKNFEKGAQHKAKRAEAWKKTVKMIETLKRDY